VLKKDKRIVVGLSGGIDSSFALILLKTQGFEPIGLSLKLPILGNSSNEQGIQIARRICKKYKIPHYVLDARKDFLQKVVNYFISKIKEGKTPNPCIFCNRYLKFKKLFDWAKKQGIKYVATGHYARVKDNKLLTGKDKQKDQSYDLCLLPQVWLRNIAFPLGDYFKKEIYRLAEKQGLKFLLKRKESQSFCFLRKNPPREFIKKILGEKRGLIIDKKGKILGEHQGTHFYTLGQRRGLFLPNGPYYVLKLDVKKNIVYVTKNKKDLFAREVDAHCFHFFVSPKEVKKFLQYSRISAKIRSTQKPVSGKANFLGRKLKLIFDKPVFAPCPGQEIVVYSGDICLGGGEI